MGSTRLSDRAESITVVSGLPRSGTSLMMQLLEAGGMPLLTDGARRPDIDNPRGYFEYEPVKRLLRDCDWVEAARGKAVKVIAALLPGLPPDFSYQVVVMRRRIEEILASQRMLLERSGMQADAHADDGLGASFERELGRLGEWLATRENFRVLELDYAGLVASPRASADAVVRFLGRELDAARMAAAVDPALYRHRAS